MRTIGTQVGHDFLNTKRSIVGVFAKNPNLILSLDDSTITSWHLIAPWQVFVYKMAITYLKQNTNYKLWKYHDVVFKTRCIN